MKRSTLALTVIVAALVLALVAVLFIEQLNDSSFNSPDQNDLFIASFDPILLGSEVTAGNIVLANPTSSYFDNLTLTAKVDDSRLIEPPLRLWLPPNNNVSIPVTRISIEPYQNATLYLDLADADIPTFTPHTLSIYISQNTFGDVINGQSFTIPQKNAYLQILGYSSIEHSNNTWHEYYNNARKRYEYVNDQPNFYQQYQQSAFFPLDPSSYDWAKTLNQLGEHYFNVTIFNNSTFPVERIALFGGSPNGEGSMGFALSDKILQPNETYIFPVQAGGENWWSVENVYQLTNFFPAYAYASGDIISNQKNNSTNK